MNMSPRHYHVKMDQTHNHIKMGQTHNHVNMDQTHNHVMMGGTYDHVNVSLTQYRVTRYHAHKFNESFNDLIMSNIRKYAG